MIQVTLMKNPVTSTRQEDIAVITIDNPPVNALSQEVADGIDAAVARAQADPAIRGIVICGAGRTFVAGADIKGLEERRVGKECWITCRSRWSPYH